MSPRPACRLLAVMAVAAGLATCLPIHSAMAQGHDNGRRGNDRYDHGRGRGPEARRNDWQREHWRNEYRGPRREYSRRPDMYYSAPPVVHMPPRYYAPPPPGLSLQFGFPLYY